MIVWTGSYIIPLTGSLRRQDHQLGRQVDRRIQTRPVSVPESYINQARCRIPGRKRTIPPLCLICMPMGQGLPDASGADIIFANINTAHRTLIVRKLKGLEDIVPYTSVHWEMLEKGNTFSALILLQSMWSLNSYLRRMAFCNAW